MLQHEGEVSLATLLAAPTRHRHTEQFSGILTDPILTQPTPRGREGWEKPKHKLARKQQAIATTLCEELQASNCVHKSRGAPARGIGPPLLQLGKQLTSIASRLTLPKLHLATFINHRVVVKISSCRVNTTSRLGIKHLGVSFGSNFLLFSNKSSRGPHSQQPVEIPGPWLLMTALNQEMEQRGAQIRPPLIQSLT